MKNKVGVVITAVVMVALCVLAIDLFLGPRLRESYRIERFREVTEDTFPSLGQRCAYIESRSSDDNKIGTVSVVAIEVFGAQDLSLYCENVCDWMERCLSQVPYDEAPWLYKEMVIRIAEEDIPFDLTPYVGETFDRKGLYKGLYDTVDARLVGEGWSQADEDYKGLAFVEEPQETDPYYATIEPDCTYTTVDGVEYRLIAIDRAAGSNFYMLVATTDGGQSCYLVNEDPFIGCGGQAQWITFIDDTELGFTCLSYSGGDEGYLFRTEDGGKTYTQINYPSAKVTFSDGSIYNPFVIPEKVWRENGKIYMLAGQSPNSGDYYNEELEKHPSGLYESKDDGIIFEYVGEQ